MVLGIRPECISAADERVALTIEAPVEMIEPMGAETVVLLRLGGERVLGRIAPDIRVQPGGRGRFAIDTRKLCLFDPATERLIV